MFRSHGLRAWRKGTVGQLKAGLRKPRLDEVLLMARALSVTLDKLIPGGDDERIELGDDAGGEPSLIARDVRQFLPDRPLEDLPYERFPVDELMADALIRSEAEKKRVDVLAQPILEWAKQHDVKLAEGDWLAVFETASDTERRAARRLGVEIAQVKLSARVLWDHRDFDDDRDCRIGDIDELEPRSRQARRGLVTREMLAELRALFEEIKIGKEETAPVSGKWSTPKRCNCKDASGKELGRTCPKLSGRHHGTVGYSTRIPTTGGVRELRRFGFSTPRARRTRRPPRYGT